MAGMIGGVGGGFDPTQFYNARPPTANNALFGDPSLFGSANTRQTSDYDTIMQNYMDTAKQAPISPIAYSPSSDVTSSLGQLSDLATTGGYTPQGIADIRARDVSPIRSIYAGAQRNLDRQRSLQGGYSPNYAAATAKMARDESDIISSKITDVNANIAQAVAQNRIAAASPYAAAAGQEQGRQLGVEQFNRQFGQEALGGARSLYGTIPALTNMFGSQVAEAARLGQGQQDINIRRNLGALSSISPLLSAARFG